VGWRQFISEAKASRGKFLRWIQNSLQRPGLVH
jgi:hypothetical protein